MELNLQAIDFDIQDRALLGKLQSLNSSTPVFQVFGFLESVLAIEPPRADCINAILNHIHTNYNINEATINDRKWALGIYHKAIYHSQFKQRFILQRGNCIAYFGTYSQPAKCFEFIRECYGPIVADFIEIINKKLDLLGSATLNQTTCDYLVPLLNYYGMVIASGTEFEDWKKVWQGIKGSSVGVFGVKIVSLARTRLEYEELTLKYLEYAVFYGKYTNSLGDSQQGTDEFEFELVQQSLEPVEFGYSQSFIVDFGNRDFATTSRKVGDNTVICGGIFAQSLLDIRVFYGEKAVSHVPLEQPDLDKILLTGTGFEKKVTLTFAQEAFEKNAIEFPALVAVEQNGQKITYGELNKKATNLASALLEKGIGKNDIVAILTLRSIEMIVAIMAVLKTGAAYAPIDADLPLERIKHMLNETNAKLVLYHPDLPLTLLDSFEQCLFKIDGNTDHLPMKPVSISPKDPAYVIFTSGSTGKPKGVVVTHGNLVNHLDANVYKVEKGSRLAQVASISFDISVGDVFTTLSHCGTLLLREKEDFFACFKTATIAHLTPTALSKIEPADFPHIRVVALGGEAITNSLIAKWSPHAEIINCYGPSETTITSSAGAVENEVHIGRPLQNTVQYIVDENLELVPFGATGELIVGGSGVSLGYIGKYELTAERFIPNHFTRDGSLMYRTGDVCKWNNDGNIIIIGRQDDMVKVKGYRIELEEVNAAVGQDSTVSGSVVILKKDNLIAFVTPENADINSIRQTVLQILPPYMAPAVYIALNEFPMTSNGKIDKKALKQLEITIELERPASLEEKLLAEIWSNVLSIDKSKIGRQTTFFELGGDSISAILLATKCIRLGMNISSAVIFQKPTLALMAEAGFNNQTSSSVKELQIRFVQINCSPSVVSEINVNYYGGQKMSNLDIYPASPLQSGMIAQTQKDATSYVAQLSLELAETVDLTQMKYALRIVTNAHDILRTRFVSTSEGIYQVLQDSVDIEIITASDLKEYCESDMLRGFTLEDKLWFRLCVVNGNVAVLTIHHALYDGWCLNKIVNQIFDAYCGSKITRSVPYKRVIEYNMGQNIKDSEAFWLQYLNSAALGSKFKTLPPTQTEQRAEYFRATSSAEMEQLQQAAKKHELTIAVIAKAALLFNLFGQL
ncbi:hypothetical protein HDV01_003609 [Terramyces sp. JEL0728]|nr:hypothetical protein HDV01_003609 [Terramyces sp. JEL0728]